VFHLVLVEPEIPPNTGNVIRLCANTGCRLHLVEPLGFRLDARAVRRSGLDYHELAELQVHRTLEACLAALAMPRWFAVSTRGSTRHDRPQYRPGDAFVFGPETRGLPDAVLDACLPERRLRLPMQPGARSLNLSNAVAVLAYEAWRQQDFISPFRP
jgi:tRNA (cytidine/uridine-2'-O-)-methyltransferase